MSDAPQTAPTTGEAPSSNAATEPGKGPPAPSTGAAPEGWTDEQFQAEIKRRGHVLEDGKVLPHEHAQFRAHKRKLADRERELAEKFEGTKRELSEQLTFAQQVTALAADEDFDGLAKLLKYDGWDDIQAAYASRNADPNHRRIRILEKEKRDREEREAAEARTKAQQAAQEKRRVAVGAYMKELSETCEKSQSKLARTLAKDPEFLQAVYAIQSEHYDPATKTTVSVEQAIEMVNPRRGKSFKTRLLELKDLLHSAFTEDEATDEESVPEKKAGGSSTPAEKPQKKPVSRTAPNATAVGAPPKPFGKMTPAEYQEYKRALYASADDKT